MYYNLITVKAFSITSPLFLFLFCDEYHIETKVSKFIFRCKQLNVQTSNLFLLLFYEQNNFLNMDKEDRFYKGAPL